MMITDQRFHDQLLSVLSDKPDHLSFRALRSVLDAWPGLVSDDVLTLARESTATWPDEVCEIAGTQEPIGFSIASGSWPVLRSCRDADPDEIVNHTSRFLQAKLAMLSLQKGSESAMRGLSLRTAQSNLRYLSVWQWKIHGDLASLFFSNSVPDQLNTLIFGVVYDNSCWEALWDYLCSSRATNLHTLGFTEISPDYLGILFSNPPQKLSVVDCTLNQQTIALLEQTKSFARQMRSLRSTNRLLGDEGAGALGNCSAIVALESLQLHACGIGPVGIAALSNASFMPALRELSLYGNSIGDEGCAALSQIPARFLKSLDLRRIDCTATGVVRLAGGSLFGKLAELNLGGNRIANEGAIAIADSHRLQESRTLRSLFLWQAGIGDEGLTMLSLTDACAGLQQLHLSGNTIGDSGIAALASSPRMGQLRVLDIEANYVTQHGLEAIARSKYLAAIEKLSVGGPALDALDAKTMHELVTAKALANLREFTITCTGFSDRAAQTLAANCHNWRRLRVLEIHGSQLTDVGLRALAESQYLNGLWVLRITGPNAHFGSAGIRSLAGSGLSQLIELELENVECDVASMTALANSESIKRLEHVDIDGWEETWLASSSIRPILRFYLEAAVRAK